MKDKIPRHFYTLEALGSIKTPMVIMQLETIYTKAFISSFNPRLYNAVSLLLYVKLTTAMGPILLLLLK